MNLKKTCNLFMFFLNYLFIGKALACIPNDDTDWPNL